VQPVNKTPVTWCSQITRYQSPGAASTTNQLLVVKLKSQKALAMLCPKVGLVAVAKSAVLIFSVPRQSRQSAHCATVCGATSYGKTVFINYTKVYIQPGK